MGLRKGDDGALIGMQAAGEANFQEAWRGAGLGAPGGETTGTGGCCCALRKAGRSEPLVHNRSDLYEALLLILITC